MSETTLDPEDAKIIGLSRSALIRNDAREGAAVRDEMGRTYVATTVALRSLSLSALQTAVAMAVSSGATGLAAAAVVTDGGLTDTVGLEAVGELGGPGVRVLLAGTDGGLRASVTVRDTRP